MSSVYRIQRISGICNWECYASANARYTESIRTSAMNTFFKKYAPFLDKGDSFFVIEVLGSMLRGSLMSVASESKQATLVRVLEQPLVNQSVEAFTSALVVLRKAVSLPVVVRTIALLDHRRAAVLSGSVSLVRSDPKAEIKQAELENLISQGLWKLVAMHRKEAAIKIGNDEARIRLADADVVRVKLNNHRVVNPIGFAARTIEIAYRETFVDQAILQTLHTELTEDNLMMIVEAPTVLAGLIARLNPVADFLFVDVGARETTVYRVEQMMLSYVDSFAWGTQTLLSSVALHFAVDEAGAVAIIERYGRHEVSALMRRAIEKAVSGELAILSNGLAAHQPPERSIPVYVHASMPLPSVVFDPAFARRLGLDLMLTAVNEQFIGAHAGFVVQLQKQKLARSYYSFSTALAAIADTYALAAMPLMTKTAKRRARWIEAG